MKERTVKMHPLDNNQKVLPLYSEKTMKQLALAWKKVIYIPMSRNVVREHFESGDMFFIGI